MAKKVSKRNVKGKAPAKAPTKADPLFPSTPRNQRIGGSIRARGRDLSRFVKWPKYVRVQRQRAVLYKRLKVPPAINQFTSTLGKNEAATVFKLFAKYRPETAAVRKQRIKETAAATANKTKAPEKPKNEIQFGLRHVSYLIEQKQADLVLIANDVNPIECVVWLPALCRKMDVPFMIVKDKGRLGALVHQRTAAVVCLTNVNKQDMSQMELLKNLATEKYNNNTQLVRKWGGGIMGLKTQAKLDKRAKEMAIEEQKKIASTFN
mmetsp:Transcript_14773/g.32656  ORF Transcript_14773/g.32656 Transcript_14773/m.32656 type:complete len:264 (-) Transcript_14773:81-872(-)